MAAEDYIPIGEEEDEPIPSVKFECDGIAFVTNKAVLFKKAEMGFWIPKSVIIGIETHNEKLKVAIQGWFEDSIKPVPLRQ